MVIECSSCHVRFKLADDKIKESGTKVRCTKCREVFTVFPENPPSITTNIEIVAPVVTNEKEGEDHSFSSLADQSTLTSEPISPAIPAPVSAVSEENDWDQEPAASHFTDELSDEAGASDLDAINFDNIETPVFSVTSENNSKFEFSDDITFSFTESSIEDETEQQPKISEPTDSEALAAEGENEISNPSHTITTDGEFTFSTTENLDDFSWDEPDSTPIETVESHKTQEIPTSPQDIDFSFSSFSFDEVPPPVDFDENENNNTDEDKTTIKLSGEPEALTPPVFIRPNTTESAKTLPASPVARDRYECSPPNERTLRVRSRQKKKGSSRPAYKMFFLIFLILTLIYGILNRDQIQKNYKNIVSSFIENQVHIDTTGQIGLVKLSGGYLPNNQEGDIFVIRGEAVNEFKGLRSSVLVRGTILGENGAILQSQSAYCGNPLKDNNLKKLGFKEIRDAMNNELGENLVNLNIPQGKSVPFTIVFNKVSKNIKEFTVEVLDSKPGSK